jgi:hypothetical protein
MDNVTDELNDPMNRRSEMAREDEIRLIAYDIWQEDGCPNGRDCEHWIKAEALWEEKQKQRSDSKAIKTEPKQTIQKNPKSNSARRRAR